MTPGPTTTVPTQVPTTTTPTVTPGTVLDANSAAATASLTACLNAWQTGGITGAPVAVAASYAGIRVIDATAQVTATDPSPAAAGAAASLVLLKLGAVTTGIQVYGASTWYCIDNSLVPNTVPLITELCTSGHAADGSPGTGAKSLSYKKDKSC